MKQKFYVVFIAIIAIALLTVSFVFAINYKKNSENYFYDSGYILNNNYESGSNNVDKLYFEAETVYKINKDKKFTFTNLEGERVNVNEESFVHYSNGAIMSLKKGVALDLNNIDEKIIKYYNIFEGSILVRKGEKYEIDNLNDKISFSKLMFKISGEKYLIGAPKIVISFSDNQTVDMEDYVEIEYVSENVIRIYNDKVNYQTIASNLYIIVDDVKIDLEYKTISKNKVEYLTMADMVINSNDNIEVLPKPVEPTPEKNENNNPTGSQNNNQGTVQGNDQGIQNNGNTGGNEVDSNIQQGLDNILGNLPDENEQIDNEDNFVQPKFSVDSMQPTTLGFENLKLSVNDESSVLHGPRTVEILENSTGKVVQQFDNWEEGSSNYIVNSYFSLKPNTEYTLNVVGQYKIDDTVFDRTFISKIFRTLDIGLEIEEDCITSDSLSFAIYKNTYSEVSGFTYNITDVDGNVVVTDIDVRFNGKDVILISELEKFKENTKYILTIKDIKYGYDVFSTVSYENLKLTHETKTLKENPFKNSEINLTSKVDSRENTVTFNIDGISDVYGGIKSYTYNIYNNMGELKQSITRENSKQLTLDFEKLGGEDVVYFNVEVNFDDNEKTIIFLSQNSEVVSVSGSNYPKIVEFIPTNDNKDCETILGEVVIDDKLGFIETNNISYYKIDIKENVNSSLGNIQQSVGSFEIEYSKPNDKFALPVYVKGLKPNTEYVIYVYLMHNSKYIYIGYTLTSTLEPEPIYLTVEDVTTSNSENKIFDFQIKKEVNDLPTILFSKVKQITLDLYRCSTGDGQCKKLEFSTTIPKNQDSSDLIDMLVNDKIIEVYSSDFDFDLKNYSNGYDYKVVMKGYASSYEIPVKINGTDTNEFPIKFNDIDPFVELHSIEVLNADLGENKDTTLKDETIIGFNLEIISIPNVMNQSVKTINYSIYENPTDVKCNEISSDELIKFNTIVENQEVTSFNELIFVPVSNKDDNTGLKRGINYCIKYYGKYKNDTEEKTTNPKMLDLMAPKQSLEVEGYISGYTEDKLNLSLDINDPDDALVKDSIILSNGSESYIPKSYEPIDDYEFEGIIHDNRYALLLKENTGALEIQHKIYEFDLDKIINYSEKLNVVVDTSVPGVLTLKIPYNSDGENFNGSSNEGIANSNIDVNRIAGLSIEYGGKLSYFDLNKNSEELYTKISLNDIRNYGQVTDNKLVLGNVKIVYDSGRIIDYDGDERLAFIKSNDGNSKYYSSNKTFGNISISSIFNTKSINGDLVLNKFETNKENSSIGLLIGLDGKSPTSINFNEVLDVETVLYDNNENEATEFTIIEAITTSKINTTYTSTGAIVKFDIKNDSLLENTKIKLELKEINESAEIVYNGTSWSTYNNKSGKINNISVNDKTVTVVFDNIADQDYHYLINYMIDSINSDGEYRVTYNEETATPNQNIIVSSLKKIYVTKSSAEYVTEYWKWKTAPNYQITDFVKIIKTHFEVDTTKYLLKDNESIEYEIIARNQTDGTEIKLLTNRLLSDPQSANKLSINDYNYNNIGDKSLAEGKYTIIVRPSLKIENGATKTLDDFNLNALIDISYSPIKYNITNKRNLEFEIKMQDDSGLLSVCNSDVFEEKEGNTLSQILNTNPMTYITSDQYISSYFSENLLSSKVVYLELYYKLDGEYKYKGYTPIPFTAKTSKLDLSEFFYDNSFPSGAYKFKINYCINNKLAVFESEDINLINTSTINLTVAPVEDEYFLMIDNPNIVFKDSIQKIVYQYTTVDGVTSEPFELNNIDDPLNVGNDFEFVSLNTGNGIVYFVILPTGGRLTSTIERIRINFYSGASEDSYIHTYEYVSNNNKQ